MIDYPCRNGYCEKCTHQDIDWNCNRIKLGLSQVPCVQVSCCKGFEPIADLKEEERNG